MNTVAERTDLCIQYSNRAEELGADALMIRRIVYGEVPAAAHLAHFLDVASAVSIPIFMQDQPGATVPPAMAAQLARAHENLCDIKVENPPTIPGVASTKAAAKGSGLVIFGGYWGYFFTAETRRGAVGAIPDTPLADVVVRV